LTNQIENRQEMRGWKGGLVVETDEHPANLCGGMIGPVHGELETRQLGDEIWKIVEY
jgi:hypothetical protein